jgi:trans-aconitate methyltransferase
MKRLIEDLGENSPQEYDRIFFDRAIKGVNERDLKRWKKLIKHYKGGRFIDLGCLDSLAPILVKEAYPKEEVWGVDLAEEAIIEMAQRYPFVYYQKADI